MHRVNVGLLCLLSLSFAGSVYGQPAGNPPSGQSGLSPDQSSVAPGVATYDSYSGGATLGSGTYFNVRHMTGQGVGYFGSYSQIGAFVPLWYNEDAFIAPEVRMMMSNSSQIGGNAGLVARKYNPNMDRIFGANIYYDVDQSTANNTYGQTGVGLETLGNVWDIRANGYFPNGRQDNYVSNGSAICVSGNPYLLGNNIVFNGQQGQNREQVVGGGDVEVGLPLSAATPWLRGYVGTYFYSTSYQRPVATDDPIPNLQHQNPVGFRGRLEAWISDDLLAGVNVTTDPVWGTNVNAMVDFRFSGFKPTRYFPQWTTRERMLQPVQRNWRVAVARYGTAINTPIAAVNPTTGSPYFVDFINNAAPAGGNGSFEHPYNYFNFPNGLPGADLILVERGNSTISNPYIGTIKLFDNQRLLGEGASGAAPVPLSATYGNCTVSGNFNLPGFNGSGNYPFVSNGGGTTPVIALANNNEVAGFNIVNSGGDGIFGNGVSNSNLHDLQIIGNAGHGINLVGATGNNTIISNINLPNVADNPNPGGVGNNAMGGIFVSAGTAGLSNLQISNVFMNSNPVGTQPYGISLNANSGALTTTLTNVTVNGNGTGLILQETNQPLVATLSSVSAIGNTQDGVDVTGTNGTVTVNSTNSAAPIIANNNGGSGMVLNMTGGTAALNLSGSQFNGNGIDGLGLFGSAATTTVGITDGQLNGNVRDGLHAEQTAGSTLTTMVDPTTLSNNGSNGFFYLLGNSVMTSTFTGDTLNANGANGFFGTMNASSAVVNLTNVTTTGSTLNGFHVDASNGSSITTTIANSSISSNKQNGFDLQLSGGSSGTFTLTSTQVNANGSNGVSYLTDTGSGLAFYGISSTFDGNTGGSGIVGTAQNSSSSTLSFGGPGSSMSNNGLNGVFATATGQSTISATFDSTAINGNKADGLRLGADVLSSGLLTVTGPTTFTSNAGNGLRIDSTNGSVFTTTLTGTTISKNGLDGILFNAGTGSSIGTATAPTALTSLLILDNGTNGLETNANGAGSTINVAVVGTEDTNTSGTSPQQVGLLFTSTNGGNVTANFTGGSTLGKNGQNAVNGTVTGTGPANSSSASILLDGTNASGSGSDNVVLKVANGGLLHFVAQNGANLSNSVTGAGLTATVTDLNTVAFVDMNNVAVNGNKGAGYVATVSDSVAPGAGQAGATLYSDLERSTFNSNGKQGMNFTISGAGAVAYVGVGTTTGGTQDSVNGNANQGVLANVSNLGEINFRSIGSQFNGNGGAGAQFGGNNGTVRTLFYGGTNNGNGGDGLAFGPVSPNASDFNSNYTISLGNGWTSSFNKGYGLNVNGTGANSVFLIQDPKTAPIVLTGNGAGAENLNFVGVNQVLLQLLGSFNNMPGDGVHLNFNNITTAIVSINGLGTGTIDGNKGNGVYVDMVDVTNAAVTVTGFKSISNNGLDGVHIELTGITKTINGAVEVQGVTGDTTMANNGLNGVNIELTKVNLVNPFSSLPGVNLSVLLPNANQLLDPSAPLPTLLTGNNGIVPAHALNLDSLNIINSGGNAAAGSGNGNGIIVNGTDSTIVNKDGFITNNTVNSSQQGDGIAVVMSNTVASTIPTLDGLLIDHNYVGAVNNGFSYLVAPTASANNGNGIRVNITNSFNPSTPAGSTADGLTITNNTVTGNLGDGIQFLINNPAGSISTANNFSISGNTVTQNTGNGLNIGLSYVQADSANISNNLFLANGGDGILANLLGTKWTNLTTSGDTIDSNAVNGMELILSKSSIATWTDTIGDISNNTKTGLQITNSGASFVTGATFDTVTINKNGLDGVQMTTTDASKSIFGSTAVGGNPASPITFQNGTILDNGRLGVGNGINLTTLAHGSVSNMIFNNEKIGNTAPNASQQNGLVYTIANSGGIMNAAFTGGTISNNAIDGVNATITGTGAAGGSQSIYSLNGTTVSGNGNYGLLFNATNASLLNLTVQDNGGTGSVISKNGYSGIQINGSDAATSISATILNSSILDNGQTSNPAISASIKNGISLNLTNYLTTNIANLSVTNSTIGNTAVGGGTQTDGILINLTQNGAIPLPTLQNPVPEYGVIATIINSRLTNNVASALEANVDKTAAAGINTTTGAFVTFNHVTADGNGGNGVAFNVIDGGLSSFKATNVTTIDTNGQHGLFINATGTNSLAAALIEDSQINNNGSLVFAGDGINATALNGGNITIGAQTTGLNAVTFAENTGNGINVYVSGTNSGADIDLHNAFVGADAALALNGNNLNGLTFQSVDGGYVHLRAYNTHFDGNVQTGLLGLVDDHTPPGFYTEGLVRIIGGSADSNGGDGYSLTASNEAGGAGFGQAYLTAEFDAINPGTPNAQPISAQNNGGVGLNFVASNLTPPGGGIVGNLLITGGSLLSNNGGGSVNINMIGADSAVIGLSGTFDGNKNGDGIKIDLENISGLALVALQGPGEIKNNGGDGIDVIMKDIKQGGVYIAGFNGGISGNGTAQGAGGLGQDGIQVTMTNVGAAGGAGALTIDGNLTPNSNPPTVTLGSISGNTGNGINVTINGDAIGNSVIDNNTFNTSVLTNPLNQVKTIFFSGTDQLITSVFPNYPPVTTLPGQYPLLATQNVAATAPLGIQFTSSLAIQNWDIDNNGLATGGNLNGDGILYTQDGATIISPNGSTPAIFNNTITNTGANQVPATTGANIHDGIQVNLLNGAGFGTTLGQPPQPAQFNITFNTVGGLGAGNNGNGINFIENDTTGNAAGYSTLQALNISNNIVSYNSGQVGVSGNGIDLQLKDGPTLSLITLDSDVIQFNKGDGIQMVNPNTGFTGNVHNSDLVVNLTNFNITANGTAIPISATSSFPAGSMGVDVVLNDLNQEQTTINVLSNSTGNTISNSASFGLFLQATNAALYNLNVTGTVPTLFSANGDAGIGIVAGSFVNPNNSLDPTKFSVGNIRIDDVTIQNTIKGNHGNANYPFNGDGIGIVAEQYAEIAKFVVGDPTVRDTVLTNNAGDGLRINAIGNSEFRWTTRNAQGQDTSVLTPFGSATVQLQNIDSTLNGLNGVEIDHADAALLSWDDQSKTEAAFFLAPSNPNYLLSWQYITGGVNDSYTINANGQYIYTSQTPFSNGSTADGSFVHLNDVIASNNGHNGLYADLTNQQYPITRIDIVDSLLNGKSQFNGNGTGNVAGSQNGMLFQSFADSINVIHAQNTVVSNNLDDGIFVQAYNASTFGDVLTSSPVGDPTSPSAHSSSFDGMTLVNNGTTATYNPAQGLFGGNGIEVLSNGGFDPPNNSSNAIVSITMTSTTVNGKTVNNLFNSNAGDGFNLTANRFSTTYVSIDSTTMQDTLQRYLGGSGIHFTTNESSTTTLKATNTHIGSVLADTTTKGLSGNGIWIATNGKSTMNMIVGDQNIANPDASNTPDVTIFGNQLNGFLITSDQNSRFFGETYDTSSQRNGYRGYSALEAQSALQINQIDNSVFNDNSREGIAMIANSESSSNTYLAVINIEEFGHAYNPYHYINFTPNTVGSLVLTNSVISNNGSTSPYVTQAQIDGSAYYNVNGVEIDVSNYSYISADIRNNVMHGNRLSDFATASFQPSFNGGPSNGLPQPMAGNLSGFLVDGTINPNGLINTLASVNQENGTDLISLEDAAQMDVRFVGNVGDHITPSEGASNNPTMNANGAYVTDPSGAKWINLPDALNPSGKESTAFFQVNAYNYDTVGSVISNNVFSGADPLPMDGGPTSTVFDSTNFPGPTTIAPITHVQTVLPRPLEAGLVSTVNYLTKTASGDNYYFNPNANPTNTTTATAFTQVRVDDLTTGQNGVSGPAGNTVIGYTGATATFTLSGAGLPGIAVTDTIRVHLLDTNTFNQSGSPQDIEKAFYDPNSPTDQGFYNYSLNHQQFQYLNGGSASPGPINGAVRIPPGESPFGIINQTNGDPIPGVYYLPNPLAPYFDFPSVSFPPY